MDTNPKSKVLKQKLPFSWIIVSNLCVIVAISLFAQKYVTTALVETSNHSITNLKLAEANENNANISHTIIFPTVILLRKLENALAQFQTELELRSIDAKQNTKSIIDNNKNITGIITKIKTLNSTKLDSDILESLGLTRNKLSQITSSAINTSSKKTLLELFNQSSKVIKDIKKQIEKIESALASTNKEISKTASQNTSNLRNNVTLQNNNVNQLVFGIKWAFVIIAIFVIVAFALFYNLLHKRLANIRKYADDISEGKFNTYINFSSNDAIGDVANSVNHMGESLSKLLNKTKEQAKLSEKAKAEAEDQSWLSESLRILAETTYASTDSHTMAENAIEMISRQLGLTAAEIYLIENNQLNPISNLLSSDISSTYAVDKGIFGQVIRNKEAVSIAETSKSALNVNTGLLKGIPDTVYISPLMFDGEVNGVIELGFIQPPTQSQIQFINQASKLIAFSIHAVEQMKNEELLYVEKGKFKALEKLNLRLEKANQKAESAIRSKSAFLTNMSHEMRTPLTSIIGFGEILLQKNESVETQKKPIENIVSCGKHLLHLINDILDISKIVANEIEIHHQKTSLHKIIDEVRSIIEPQVVSKDLTLSIKIDENLKGDINTDPFRLKQILLQLCDNAIKFTKKGYININVEVDTQNEKIVFLIEDSGIGLTSDQMEHIFELFDQADSSRTRNYGGTGLGLSLSKKLSHLLGGNLSVESQLNQGSQFRLCISTGSNQNLESTIQPADKISTSDKKGTSLNGSVLVAEDTEMNQDLLAMYLETLGVNFDIVENGKLALNKALQGKFDLIIMDMQMPVMDGPTATRELRKKGYEKPIIALTANAMKEDEEIFMAAGCNEFVTKPIDQDRLETLIRNYIPEGDCTESNSVILPIVKKQSKKMDKIRERFVNDVLLDYCIRMQNALREEDWKTLKEELHKLKGTGGNFGYPMLSELCTDIENFLLEKDIEQISHLLESLKVMCLQIIEGIKQQAS